MGPQRGRDLSVERYSMGLEGENLPFSVVISTSTVGLRADVKEDRKEREAGKIKKLVRNQGRIIVSMGNVGKEGSRRDGAILR